MGRRINLKTRAFGAEPGVPDVAALAEWIAEHRGVAADLHSYLLEESLAPQCDAGIGMPCAGGRFMKDRILESLIGVKDGKAVDEMHVDTGPLVNDAYRIIAQHKHAWCAIPAPHVLGITDRYFHDDAEWQAAITGAYRTLMRAQRDAGIEGHVVIGDRIDDAEIAALSWQKVFFFQEDPDQKNLKILLERQRVIAAGDDVLDTVFDLADEYDLGGVVVMDPDDKAIRHALLHLDPDQVSVGGYCTEACDDYWKDLVEHAYYTK